MYVASNGSIEWPLTEHYKDVIPNSDTTNDVKIWELTAQTGVHYHTAMRPAQTGVHYHTAS